MSGTKYKWAGSEGIRGLKAQQVGEALEDIRTHHNGRLTPELVVDAAKDKKSPLYRYFEWDDAKAGTNWRKTQASLLIRSITIVVEVKKGKQPKLRAFVSVKRGTDRSYTSIAHAMSDEDLRKQVLADAWNELEAWRTRYANLSEFAKIHAAIDRMKKPKGL